MEANKLTDYTGRWHVASSYIKEKWKDIKTSNPATDSVHRIRDSAINYMNREQKEDDYSHIFRKKTRLEMIRISAAVMGIEFCYAAETAFGAPTMLKIGIHHSQMTLVWCLSPFVGFFLTPILGSLSDKCKSTLGRRRPFIILLSFGIILGLIVVPNGKAIGTLFGDVWEEESVDVFNHSAAPHNLPFQTLEKNHSNLFSSTNNTRQDQQSQANMHPWTLFFTIVGMMTLDFSADACQSPSRAYLLDITIPEDHAIGLSTFTIMAGLGGSLGYAMGGINWDKTFIGTLFGGHLRALFAIVTFIFIGCVFSTLLSFKEIPLTVLHKMQKEKLVKEETLTINEEQKSTYGSIPMTDTNSKSADPQISNGTNPGTSSFSSKNPFNETNSNYSETKAEQETTFIQKTPETYPKEIIAETEEDPTVTLKQYFLSIVFMPNSLRVVCLTNLFCWMSLVCYSLNFTDFVGEDIFGGNFEAPEGSFQLKKYEEGVRFACWGMAIYSLSCSGYSFLIEKLVKKFGARPVYICGPLVYSLGMLVMGLVKHRALVIILSCTAGVMYATLFTMPYLLVAHYHATGTFSQDEASSKRSKATIRGLGTDVAIVSSMVFLAQFILSSSIGAIIEAVHSTVAVIYGASILALCGAISACFVTYLDL